MRVFGTFAFKVYSVNHDMNMRVLFVEMPKCDKLIVVISHALQVIIDYFP